MSGYDVSQYLLDKENIRDTISTLCWSLDRSDFDLERSILSNNPQGVIFDDRALFGPDTSHDWMSVDDHIASDIKLTDAMVSTHNALAQMLIDLPQPSPSATRPTKVTCQCNITTHIVMKGVPENTNPNVTYGGYYTITVLREDESTGNPWKISTLVTTKLWLGDNVALMGGTVYPTAS